MTSQTQDQGSGTVANVTPPEVMLSVSNLEQPIRGGGASSRLSLSPDVSGPSTPGGGGDSVTSSPASSPDTGRRSSNRKSSVLRDLGDGLRRAGASFRGSVESLLTNCTRSTPDVHDDRRRIRIEVVNERVPGGNFRRRGASGAAEADDDSGGNDWTYEHPDHNFTSSLTLDSLEDGVFSAKVPLDSVPFGDIVIRVRSYRIEIVLDRRELHPERRLEDSHRVTRPSLVGSIDVPIYVDPTSLHFRLEPEVDVLLIEGAMKGYLNRKLSASTGDVRSAMLTSLQNRRRLKAKVSSPGVAVVSESLDDGSKVKDPCGIMYGTAPSQDWMSRFRSRAYTR